MADQTHYKTLMKKEFFGSHDLKGDLTVTIREVKAKKILMGGGLDKDSVVAYLEGQKPIILNATNLKSIEKLYGSFIEGWAGKQVTLYASTTAMKGETVDCVRIRPTVRTVLRSITDERLAEAIASINAGKFTEEKLRSTFELTAEQSERLVADLFAGVDATN